MSSYIDLGIILGSYDLSDSDKIISIYCRENGLIKAVAKGAKKQKSKFKGKLEKISCSKFQFAKGRNLDIISEIEHITSFAKLRKTLPLLTYGFLFTEIVKSFAHEGEVDSYLIYDLLFRSLDELASKENLDLESIRFILEFLSIHGLKPHFENCVSCSASIIPEENPAYSFTLGGLLCKNCLSVEHKILSKDIVFAIKNECDHTTDYGIFAEFTNERQRVLADTQISNETYRKALEILREYINHHAKNEIKSFELLFSL